MPPAQKPTGAEGAARALPREQPVTAEAATPTPVNNESAGAEGAEFIDQDLSPDPPGNDDLLQRWTVLQGVTNRLFSDCRCPTQEEWSKSMEAAHAFNAGNVLEKTLLGRRIRSAA